MTNALDLGKEALARFRKLYPKESLDQQCQRMSGYYTQWAYQDNEIGIKVYSSANAAWSASPKPANNTKINEAPVGSFCYWAVGTYGHVAMVIGYDGGRALILHTSPKGDEVLRLDPFWRVSHADTYPFTFRGWTHTNGANPRMAVTGWSPNPEPGPKQRKVVAAGSNARTEPRSTATKVKVLAPHSLVDMVAVTDAGELVNGNSRWFKTAEGHWAWSGGFTSQAKTSLTDLTPPPPPVLLDVIFKGPGAPPPVKVEAGKPVARPADPTREGYDFKGWVVGPGADVYDFSKPVTAGLELHTMWLPVPVTPPPVVTPPNTDVPPGWFVNFITALGAFFVGLFKSKP